MPTNSQLITLGSDNHNFFNAAFITLRPLVIFLNDTFMKSRTKI